MKNKDPNLGFELELDEDAAKKFVNALKDEGLMRAGFVIHESNNLTVSVKTDSKSSKKNEE